MRAWRVNADFSRMLVQLSKRPPPPGGAAVRMQAAPVLSYLKPVIEGKLGYLLPPAPFTPGTNGIGVVEAVGPGVRHLVPNQRVFVDPHLVVDERVREPAQILIGLTATRSSAYGGIADISAALQRDWPDGTFTELAYMPASVLTPLPSALDTIPGERLVGLSKFAVPYGGFLRGGLQPGETVLINGASGYFGSAGAILAVALGASRVVAVGRDGGTLAALAAAAGPRVITVTLSGDRSKDTEALISAADGRADLALDIVGRADSASATAACLYALRRGGRLVMMGSASVPLELGFYDMLANDWQVMGCFMYPKDVPARLAALVASGQLDLGLLNVRVFPLEKLDEALAAAGRMRGLDLTALSLLDVISETESASSSSAC
jgi:alcohol dehydrogenase